MYPVPTMTLREATELVANAGERCPICRRHWRRKTRYRPDWGEKARGRYYRLRLVSDHCHACGAPRGVLCSSCNANLERREPAGAWSEPSFHVRFLCAQERFRADQYLAEHDRVCWINQQLARQRRRAEAR